MKKKLLLINPVNKKRSGFSLLPNACYPPLGLGIAAQLTPASWEVEILDENYDTFSYTDATVVGLTAFTSAINRAYEIASLYKKRGVPTVIGGIHASMLPNEALQFADSVVVGEAEGSWPRVLKDIEQGTLKKIYRNRKENRSFISPARHDLFHPGYTIGSIQTARGCPMACTYCSVTTFNGHTYRQREINDVLDELETIGYKKLYFVDDNIYGHGKDAADRAIALFKGIIKRGIKKDWFSQASINFSQNDEVLHYAAKSGCRMILLGIEANDPAALRVTNKKLNVGYIDRYEKIFRKINSHGIAVLGSFIYGMDTDSPKTLSQRTDFIVNSNVDAVQVTLLTPLPGTKLFSSLKDEGRLLYTNFPDDWEKYDMTQVVFEPRKMRPHELLKGLFEGGSRIYNPSFIWAKYLKTLNTTKSFTTAGWAYATNFNYSSVGMNIFLKRNCPTFF